MPFWNNVDYWSNPIMAVNKDEIKGPVLKKEKPDSPYVMAGCLDGDHKSHCEKKLADEGLDKEFEIVLPKPNQLQLDYDTPELPERFTTMLEFLTAAYCPANGYLTYKVTESRHGNRHVTIDLPTEIDDVARIAWQSIFGSDFKRDGASMISVVRGILNPTLLFERKNSKPIFEGVSTPKVIPPPVGRKFRTTNVSGN